MPARLVVKKRSKYRAVPTIVDGIRFASKREAARYGELKALEKDGQIRITGMQVPFFLVMEGGKQVGKYIADFVYWENGKLVVEDCKGFRTAVYKLKKRMVEAQYGFKIRET